MNGTISSTLTIIAASFSMLFGLIYLIRPLFMTYHGIAVRKKWNQLDREFQVLILALMRCAGGGLIAGGTAMTILQIEFMRNHSRWIALTILIIGGVLAAGSLYAILLVRTKTMGRPPLVAVMIFFLILLTGYLFNTFVS